jgi:hypothetical protein
MPQRASVFCNFYIRVDREALVSERALDVGSVAFKAMSTKNIYEYLKRYFTLLHFIKCVLWRTINLGRQISDISKKSKQATIYCHYD